MNGASSVSRKPLTMAIGMTDGEQACLMMGRDESMAVAPAAASPTSGHQRPSAYRMTNASNSRSRSMLRAMVP